VVIGEVNAIFHKPTSLEATENVKEELNGEGIINNNRVCPNKRSMNRI